MHGDRIPQQPDTSFIDRLADQDVSRRFAQGAAAGLLILTAACSVSSDDSPRPHNPGAGKQHVNTACLQPEVEVYPGSAFSRNNLDDLQDQVHALRVAHNPAAEVSVGTVKDAAAIVSNSLRDPTYARAFTYADWHIARVRSARQLLKMGFNSGDGACLQRGQVREAESLYKSLDEGLAPKTGRQMSAAARAVFEVFKTGYTKFKREYRQELG
jgi:hypothetical protein